MKGERGSIAPLGIGLLSISLALIFTLVCANSLYVLKNRLTATAEFAALAEARMGLTAATFLDESEYPEDYFVDEDYSSDQKTTEVTVCAIWSAPLPIVFSVTDAKICGHGAARAG
jgi:hypothetical protein